VQAEDSFPSVNRDNNEIETVVERLVSETERVKVNATSTTSGRKDGLTKVRTASTLNH